MFINQLAIELFGKNEFPFVYDFIDIDDVTKEPFLTRHDGRGNCQHQARWNGKKWEIITDE